MRDLTQLRKLMQLNSLSCLVVVPGPNMSYLTGSKFHLSERPVVFIVEMDKATFILPELESAKISKFGLDSITYNDKEGPEGAFRKFSNSKTFSEVGIESRTIRHLELDLLQRTGIASNFVDSIDIFAQLRMYKSNDELSFMRTAVEIAEKSLENVLDNIRRYL